MAMAIIAVLATVSLPALGSSNSAAGIRRAGYEVSGILEQARSHAMAYNTYTWVGFAPQPDGTLVVGVVAAKNGEAAPLVTDTAASNADVTALGRLCSLPQVNLFVPPPSSARPSTRADGQLGSLQTAIHPFVIGQGGRKISFDKYVVQFNSRGETRISPSVQPLIEIGLNSSQNPANYAAVQIGGLSGSVMSYRP